MYYRTNNVLQDTIECCRMRKGVARTVEVELNEEPASAEAYSLVCNNL